MVLTSSRSVNYSYVTRYAARETSHQFSESAAQLAPAASRITDPVERVGFATARARQKSYRVPLVAPSTCMSPSMDGGRHVAFTGSQTSKAKESTYGGH